MTTTSNRAEILKLRREMAKRHSPDTIAAEVAASHAPGDKAFAEFVDTAVKLRAMESQAARMGVTFDAREAIRNRMTIKDASTQITEAMIASQAAETFPMAVPSILTKNVKGSVAASPADKKAMWAKAFRKQSKTAVHPSAPGS